VVLFCITPLLDAQAATVRAALETIRRARRGFMVAPDDTRSGSERVELDSGAGLACASAIMVRLRASYADAAALRLALDQEIARGVLLVKGPPPDGLEFRARITVEIVAPGGAVAVDTEVVSILPGVGVAVAFPPARIAEVRALLDAPPPSAPAPEPEAPSAEEPVSTSGAQGPAARATTAEKIQLALHGTREDRAAILKDQNRTLHGYVLKSPQVTIEEITAWAKNPLMNADFLKQIGERKEWLSSSAIAQALVRNPKTPPELAVRALEHVGAEALRQMAKGVGAPPHVVQAARRRVIGK
jgi:hypothetical protein